MKTQTLCADNFTSCLGLCGNAIYLSVFKQHHFVCAFFVIKTPVWRLDCGLTDGSGERRKDGWRQRGGGWSARKIARLSIWSDENILNANEGGNYPESNWILVRGGRKMHRKESGVPICTVFSVMTLICCNHLSYIIHIWFNSFEYSEEPCAF